MLQEALFQSAVRRLPIETLELPANVYSWLSPTWSCLGEVEIQQAVRDTPAFGGVSVGLR